MSQCGRTHLLEAVVFDEAQPALEASLREHAVTCARCRHELNWLETERRVVRQRAGRDEVQQLWQGFEARAAPRRNPSRTRLLVGVAAAWLLVLSAGRLALPLPTASHEQAAHYAASDDSLSFSFFEPVSESTIARAQLEMSSEDIQQCSRLTPEVGFHCGQTTENTLASR